MSDHVQHTPIIQKPKLLDLVRATIRTKHYSLCTEESYVNWIKRFILFHNKKHPRELAEREINGFLTHLAVNKKVSASTQNQASCAIVFLYKHLLNIELGDFGKENKRKIKTVELVVENEPWEINKNRIPANKLIGLKVKYGEVHIGKLIRAAGGK